MWGERSEILAASCDHFLLTWGSDDLEWGHEDKACSYGGSVHSF